MVLYHSHALVLPHLSLANTTLLCVLYYTASVGGICNCIKHTASPKNYTYTLHKITHTRTFHTSMCHHKTKVLCMNAEIRLLASALGQTHCFNHFI